MRSVRRFAASGAALALVVGLVVGLPTTASAETSAPWLDAVSRTTPSVVGGDSQVGIHITAHDNGGSHFGSWFVRFVGPSGTQFYVQSEIHESGADAIDEVRSAITGHWLESGVFRAESVLVIDGQRNTADYVRSGDVLVDNVVVRTHALDLSVLDFSVVNPDGDASAPTLSDLSLLSSTVDSGDAVVLRYVGHDTGSGIASVSATFVNPSDTSTAASIGLMSPTEPELAAIGPASAVVPVPKAGGAYVLSSLNVTDRAGNLTVYGPGAVVTQPPGISPKPDVVDLSALALTIVSTGAADTTPPVLDAVTMSTSAIRHPGDEVLFSVDAHDVGSAVTGIYVYLQDAEGHYEFAQMLNCSYEHGVLGWWIRPVYPAGSWKVTHVALTDAMGNTGLYFPDGTAQDTAGHPIAGHVFTGSFTVVDGPPTEENLTIPPCDPISVDAAPNDVYATPGSSVTIRGAVHKGALRVQAPLVAVYSTVGRTTSLVGIVRGSSTGSFARTVTVGTSTSFRSRFLGSGRVPDAGATTSRASNVFVGTRQSVASGARSLSVRAGRAATLSAVVWPRRTSLAVTLQRKVGTSWRFVAAPRTVAGGVVTWRVPRPTSTTAYRWFLPYAAGHLPSTSSVITVRRG